MKRQPVPQPPDGDDSGISEALAFTTSFVRFMRRCKDFIDILIEEASGFETAQEIRTRKPLDDPLMSGREVLAARINFSGKYATDTLIFIQYFVDNI